MKRRNWILLAVLLLAMLALSGCGVSHEGVDVTTVAPEGPWQQFVVWPLANILIAIDAFLAGMNIPYHWGFAIIAFTFIVKLLTFPLTLQQTKGMQAQKDIQPRMQELQKKYGKDREKLAAEQMKLYQEAGVNPLSGCLPLVIQMPILFGLYAALVAVGPMLKDASFFWIPDLSFPQYSMGLGWISEAWAAGNYGTLISYLVLPVLLVISQVVMQKWMTPAPAGGDGAQAGMTQNMSLIMTLFFGFFTLQVPAGLSLYWVASNFLQILQQWSVTKFFIKKPATPAVATAGGGSNAVIVDSKATKNGSAANTPAASTAGSSANGSSSSSRPASTPAAAKTGKPTNRPKAKGK